MKIITDVVRNTSIYCRNAIITFFHFFSHKQQTKPPTEAGLGRVRQGQLIFLKIDHILEKLLGTNENEQEKKTNRKEISLDEKRVLNEEKITKNYSHK